jgi:hypothetical protein
MMPAHEDVCRHGIDCYVGTFKYADWRVGEDPVEYDVYVYLDGITQWEVCLRYGSSPDAHLSPGTLPCLLQYKQNAYPLTAEYGKLLGVYGKATELLLKVGSITWQRK